MGIKSGWEGSKTSWGGDSGVKCLHSHPALPIGDHLVYGGSCGHPVHTDADVYIGLDYNFEQHKQRFPWEPGHAVHFKIKDGCAPADVADFKSLIKWLAEQVTAGQKVHIGCIGGHGRTGLVLAALVKEMTGNADASAYVREHYCKRAIESSEQVEFLKKHYGIKPVDPSHGSFLSKGSKSMNYGSKIAGTMAHPLKAKFNIWGKNLFVSAD